MQLDLGEHSRKQRKTMYIQKESFFLSTGFYGVAKLLHDVTKCIVNQENGYNEVCLVGGNIYK